MRKIYHLGSCGTCQRIISELGPLKGFEMQELKENPITEAQLEAMRTLTDSYESLFSRRAVLFRQKGLHEKTLMEKDYKALLLEHYTFLKRPVILYGTQLFIGNSKKTVEAAKAAITS